MAGRISRIDTTAALPEADCIEGFAHPRDTLRLFGHDGCERELAEALKCGRLHHGWLLCGAPGIGKATLAYRFAKFALADEADRLGGDGDGKGGALGVREDCSAARQVRAQAHPGLLVIRRPYDVKTKRFAANIPVDEVRRIRSFLTHSGGDGAWRVVIIDSADELNVNAANAVLKSLEEPPERTVFLLVTSEPGRLLPTIRSRCRVLQMNPLGRADLERACNNALLASAATAPDREAFEALLGLSDGRVGRLLMMLGGDGVAVSGDVETFLGRAARPDWSKIHALGDKLAPVAAAQRFELFFELLLSQLAGLIRERAAGAGGSSPDTSVGGPSAAMAGALISDGMVSEWAALWEDISRSKSDVVALNLDKKAFIVDTAEKLHALARDSRVTRA